MQEMTLKDFQRHLQDIKNELSMLLFHEQTLIRETEQLKSKFESKIVKPMTTKVSGLKDADLEIDVIQIGNADEKTVEARKAFYYASRELADTRTAIEVKKEMYRSYQAHVNQEKEKMSKPLNETMIYDAYQKLNALKDLTPEEEEAKKHINSTMLKTLNQGREARQELYDTMKNIILQHGGSL